MNKRAKNEKTFARKSRVAAILIAFVIIISLYVIAAATPHSGLLDFRFNTYAILSATTLVINLGLFVYLVKKPARTEERVWLAVYFAGLCAYAAGELLERLSAAPLAASFWGELSVVGGLAPVGLFLFTLAYTNQSERRFPAVTAILLAATVALAFFFDATNILLDLRLSGIHLYPWGYYNLPGVGQVLTVLWYDGFVILAMIRLITFRRHTRNAILRKQSLVFIIASVIPIAVGTFTDAILPILGINVLPPLAIAMFTPAGILLIYGILRYQLFTLNPTLFSNAILGIMQEAVVVTDDKFNVVYTNPEAKVLLGLKADSEHQLLLTDKITPDTLSVFEAAFTEPDDASQTILIKHVDIVRPHTEAVPVRVRSTMLRLTDYETRVMVLTDITDELHTQSIIERQVQIRTGQLHQARAYLVSSINSLEQGFVLINREAKVEMVNGMAGRLFGARNDDAAGKTCEDMVRHMTWNVDLAKAAHKVLETKHHRQLNAESDEGSFYKIYLTPILSGEHVLGVAIIIEDITEQKIMDRSKDEFFSIASHELRTPLTAIRGNMSMIKEYFPAVLKDESLASMINDTHDASTRLIEIVNDFLDSSKLEQGKMEFNLQPVDPLPIIETIAKELQPLLSGQQDTISLDGLKELPKIEVDEGRFRQIMYNLLSNATKYTNGGTITLTAEHDARDVHIRVIDTGDGMSPESQKLLFHKFQQAGDSILTRANTKGTGLGLYISRLLASRMHGSVELERSEPGKGSTFTLTLPLAKK